MHTPEQKQIDHQDTQQVSSDAELINKSVAMEAGRLILAAEQSKTLRLPQSDDKEKDQAADGLSREELVNIVLNAAISAEVYLSAGSKTVGANPNVLRLVKNPRLHTAEAVLDDFAESGVSEIVTIREAPLHTKFNSIDPLSPRGEDQVVAIHYETVARAETAGIKYPYLDIFGRRGTYFDFHMFLPKTDADLLLHEAKSNPQVIREVGDIIMQQEAEEEWDRHKPPYKSWEEINAGMSRIALRTNFNQTPVQSQILDFKISN